MTYEFTSQQSAVQSQAAQQMHIIVDLTNEYLRIPEITRQGTDEMIEISTAAVWAIRALTSIQVDPSTYRVLDEALTHLRAAWRLVKNDHDLMGNDQQTLLTAIEALGKLIRAEQPPF